MKVTWDELDRLDRDEPQPRYRIPDLLDQGEGDWNETRQPFPENLHDFIFLPIHVRRSGIADADVEKFMKGKPELTEKEIIAKLPEWLRDLYDAFLPQPASVLSPHRYRSWDHKIELIPGKEPPYFKNRPMSPQEPKVIRKWLDDNQAKGFIRESKALLAAKPGGGPRSKQRLTRVLICARCLNDIRTMPLTQLNKRIPKQFGPPQAPHIRTLMYLRK